MKKIIFIDLDGTLKDDSRQISQTNIDALHRAKAAGYILAISTGRPFQYNRLINERCGNVFSYAISSTGAIIYDFARQTIIAKNTLPKTAVKIICKLDSSEILWFLHCTDELFTTREPIPEQNNINIQITKPIKEFIRDITAVQVCLASCDFDLIKGLEAGILAIPGIQIANRHKTLSNPSHPRRGLAYYDITASGVSKGRGIETLCALLEIPKEHRTAIGDDINDLSMFTEVGTSVAMGNGLPKVKEAADHITETNNNDGVAKFLDLLLKKV